MSSTQDRIRLSDVTLAEAPASLPKTHPLVNADSHMKLMDFVMPRLRAAKLGRESRLARLIQADKQIYGWIRLTSADQKRKDRKDANGQPYAIDQHMPLGLVRLQDAISYFSGIFAPTRGMFQHVGDKNQQEAGKDLLKVMNQQAQHAGYYRQLMRAILDIHKYNMGGLIVEWDTEPGLEIFRRDGAVEVSPTIVWEGNRTEAVDLYNAFWSAGVPLLEIDTKAEFFATTRLTNYFELQKKGAAGEWLNLREALGETGAGAGTGGTRRATAAGVTKTSLYKYPPAELQLSQDALTSSASEWAFMSYEAGIQGGEDGFTSINGLFEFTRVWIWLNPVEMKLVARNADNKRTRNRLELWKLGIVDGAWLVSAEHVPNIHARIPVAMGSLSIDALEEWQRSSSEVLRPLQDFLSFLLNTHVKGVRKNIWGLTFYNANLVDMNQLEEGEVAGAIPVKPGASDLPLDRVIFKDSRTVDTSRTMQDFTSLLGVMQQLIPTQAQPSQIAGIDRAVDRQVAAVIQGGNRPLLMNARILDETMLRTWRTLLYFNLIQFQDDVEVVDTDGSKRTIEGNLLQDIKLEYVLGQGLKAIDKQLVAQEIQRVLFAVLQSQSALEQIDVVGLMDAWSDYLDVELDLTQFRIQQPQQAAGAEGGAAAAGLPAEAANASLPPTLGLGV